MRKRYNNGGGNNRRGRNQNRSGGGAPRPRKNFRALQEKFLNQAKDAMSSGDRILAEYYLQHADHYYRMNEEFLEERARYQEERNAKREKQAEQAEQDSSSDDNDEDDNESEDDNTVDTGSTALPSFITSGGGDNKGVKVVNLQDWDE